MILIKTERDTLLKPLLAVIGIVEKRHTMAILSNVLIERSQGILRFVASDLEIEITTQLSQEMLGDDFSITTSAAKLKDILSSTTEKTEVTLESKDDKLTIKAGKSRFNLQCLPADDFPLVKTSAIQAEFSIAQRELKNLLHLVQYAMAAQDIRYYLNGLLMQVEGNEVRLVSTDAHRLAFASATIGSNLEKTDVILPRKTIQELSKALQDSDELIQIELLTNQVRFNFGSTVMISKVIDGKFPDYKRVIPLDNQNILMVNRLAFLQSLKRASILANEKFRGMRIVLKEGTMSIFCANNEQEEAQDDLEIEYSGEEIDIGFNIQYIQDVLSNVSAEQIQIAFGDASRSALFTLQDNTSFKYVVMPMRI
ncbi:MAG: DNA polymerase III subunit beta [Neisseriaceae bacterium]|nr:DNA polymerase III subunit beta [Neisseriaceae bacterium]